MRWFELFFLLAAGIAVLAIGCRIWKKQQITLLHEYHYKNVKEEDKQAYAEGMGKGLLWIGGGTAATGILNFATNTSYGWAAFAIGFCVGLILLHRTQKTYNGGCF